MSKHTITLAVALFLSLSVLSGIAFAAKGAPHKSPSGNGTVTVVLLNSTDGLPHAGQQVSFTVATLVTDRPYVRLDCYQNGVWVFDQWAGFYADFSWPWMQTFTLANSMWTGGAADCTATLYYYAGRGWTDITASPFHVYQ